MDSGNESGALSDWRVRARTCVYLNKTEWVWLCNTIRGFFGSSTRDQNVLLQSPQLPSWCISEGDRRRSPPQRSHTYSEKQYETQRLVSIFHAAGPSLARWVRRRKKKQKVAGRGERTREAQLLLLLLLLRRSSCWKDVLMLQLSRGAGAAPCHGPQHPTHPPQRAAPCSCHLH